MSQLTASHRCGLRARGNTVVAVGPTGSDVSTNGGRTWSTFDTTDYDGIHCAADGACWASGPEGAVAKLNTPHTHGHH